MTVSERPNRRAHPRHPIELDVQLVLADGTELAGRSIDVGVGGMRLSAAPTPAFGETLTLRFRLPALDHDTEVQGVVRWVDDHGSAGVQFLSLRAREVWALNELFRKA